MTEASLVQVVGMAAQFGFAAMMAVLLWFGYKALIPRLLDVIDHNSTAMEKVAGALHGNTESIERLNGSVVSLEKQFIRLSRKDGSDA